MKMRKFLTFVLVVVTLLSCFAFGACNDAKDDGKNSGIVADKYIVKEGFSDYYIVLSKKPQEKESFAAQELSYIIKEASGCTLPIINEKEVKSNYKYISLGKTLQFSDNFADTDLSALKGTQSAYYISTKDENIYIVSSDSYDGYGCLYGVYDLLYDTVGYTYYAEDEVYVDKNEDVNLVDYKGEIVKPSIDKRTLSTFHVYTNDMHNVRLRFLNFSRGKEWDNTTNGHGQIQKFVNNLEIGADGKTLGESHPDWFINPSAEVIKGGMIENGLCWTAGDELEEYVADKMIEYVKNNKEATYFMCGQEDTKLVCTCDRCKKAKEEWGGSDCGLQIAFMNGVIERVQQWLDENEKGRTVYFVIYAYYGTEQPPVKKENDEYVPYSDKVIPHENLRIKFAPIAANFAYQLDSPQNKTFYENLQGWKAIANGHLFIYTYSLTTKCYFAQFNNFGTLTGNMRDFVDAGVEYVLDQGISDTNATCFDEMRTYVESRIMWDVSLNYDELANDFIDHYYKQAAESMRGLYQLIRDRYAYFYAAVNPGIGSINGVLYNEELYTLAFVRKMEQQIKLALESIKDLEATDNALYTTLKNRIQKENLSVIYLKKSMYGDYCSETELLEMKEIWEYYTTYFGIDKGGEGLDLANLFAE